MHPDAKTRCVSRKQARGRRPRRPRAPHSAGQAARPSMRPHQPQGGGRYYPMYAQNFNPQQTDLYRGSAASSSFGGRSDDYYDDDDEEGEEGMGHEEGGAQYAAAAAVECAPLDELAGDAVHGRGERAHRRRPRAVRPSPCAEEATHSPAGGGEAEGASPPSPLLCKEESARDVGSTPPDPTRVDSVRGRLSSEQGCGCLKYRDV